MSDPNEMSGMSVTIKGDEPGGKYNDPKSPGTWIVFHGTPVRIKEQIIEVFELDAGAAERPLFDLINEATNLFKASANASKGLGAKVAGQGSVLDAGPSGDQQAGSNGDVWAQAAAAKREAPAQEQKEDADPILVALEQCKTVAEVQQVWAENQAAFNSNPDYMAAYKARGKALS